MRRLRLLLALGLRGTPVPPGHFQRPCQCGAESSAQAGSLPHGSGPRAPRYNPDMEYVNLGKAGIKVSRICLGAMTYGSKRWREWVLEEEEGRPFIRRALELGINFFDTADMYSLGASEEILGRALKDFGPSRDRVVIATKVFNPMG